MSNRFWPERPEQDMNDWLKNIGSLEGVEGSLIILKTGEITGQMGLDQYKPVLTELARRILRILGVYQKVKDQVGELEVVWQNKRIIAVADDGLIILTICGNDAAFPLVRMTLNVTLAGIRNNKKTQKVLKKARDIKVDHLRTGDLDQSEINLISKLQ